MWRRKKTLGLVFVLTMFSGLLFYSPTSCAAEPPLPPDQPATGAGGYDYAHAGYIQNGPFWADGHQNDDNYRYFLYEPSGPSPQEAPVVLFLHGWAALDPPNYGAWIEHMVRKGYVVVWVQYQRQNVALPWFLPRHIIVAWKDALTRLDQEPDHVRPLKTTTGEYRTAIVGHSAGGYLGAVIAAKASQRWRDIPQPEALVAIEPGGEGILPRGEFSEIDPATKVLIVTGDDDTVVCKATAVSIWQNLTQIPAQNKDFLHVYSDSHGEPSLISNHFFPATGGFLQDALALNSMDYYVTFKLSVAALNCTFQGEQCSYAFGNGAPEQVGMGAWSDGQPVEPMLWVEDPGLLQASCE